MQMQNKVAIVTGGGTGVGRATSLALAKLGCSVVVNCSRSRDEADATVQEITELGARGFVFQGDVADDAACRAMVAETVATFGRVDVLVNCAGTTDFIAFQDVEAVSDETWLRLYKVNVVGAFHCARAVREPMLAVGGGVIINISSVAAQLPSRHRSRSPLCSASAWNHFLD